MEVTANKSLLKNVATPSFFLCCIQFIKESGVNIFFYSACLWSSDPEAAARFCQGALDNGAESMELWRHPLPLCDKHSLPSPRLSASRASHSHEIAAYVLLAVSLLCFFNLEMVHCGLFCAAWLQSSNWPRVKVNLFVWLVRGLCPVRWGIGWELSWGKRTSFWISSVLS